uniref:Uncharacterized protein n=1 Tax=Ixodes ricinus TaxID=34613 RepID=A0A6B0UQZ8_IXORI
MLLGLAYMSGPRTISLTLILKRQDCAIIGSKRHPWHHQARPRESTCSFLSNSPVYWKSTSLYRVNHRKSLDCTWPAWDVITLCWWPLLFVLAEKYEILDANFIPTKVCAKQQGHQSGIRCDVGASHV